MALTLRHDCPGLGLGLGDVISAERDEHRLTAQIQLIVTCQRAYPRRKGIEVLPATGSRGPAHRRGLNPLRRQGPAGNM
jgi:hypothetical protein